MTRSEAEHTVFMKLGDNINTPARREYTQTILNMLEALGLIKFDKIELVSSTRPVQWGYLKKDFDKVANDILDSYNPDALREAIRNFKYLIEELG